MVLGLGQVHDFCFKDMCCASALCVGQVFLNCTSKVVIQALLTSLNLPPEVGGR